MWLAEPVAGLAALIAIMLYPPVPSADMQQYIDRGMITGAEASHYSVMLWDALRRHDIAPLWERTRYCDRGAYQAIAATLRIESGFNPLLRYLNRDGKWAGSFDRGLAQINDTVPPERASDAEAHDGHYAIDYIVRHWKRGLEHAWHGWGRYLRPRWCGEEDRDRYRINRAGRDLAE